MATLSLLTSVGFNQIFGLKLCARPGFPVDFQMNETNNSAFLREAFSLVGFITVYNFILLCNKIIAQIHKYFRLPSEECNEGRPNCGMRPKG